MTAIAAAEGAQASAPDNDPPTPWRGAVLLLLSAFTPVMAYVSQQGFVPTVAIAGALLVFPTLLRPRPPSVGFAILLLLAAWELATLTWSVGAPRDPNFHKYGQLQSLIAIKLWLELALFGAVVVAANALSTVWARRALLVLAVGLAIVAVIVAVEAFEGAAWFQWIERTFDRPMRPDWAARNVKRATYYIAVLFWPVVLFLTGRRLPILTALLVVGEIVAVAVFSADAPIVALIVSTVLFFAIRRLGAQVLWVCLAGAVVFFLAAPFVVEAGVRTGLFAHLGALPGSWGERLRIWSFTDSLVLKNPLVGWGIQGSRAFQPAMPMHPHDVAMQLWLELGVPGAVLAALFWSWLVLAIKSLGDRTGDWSLAGAAAGSAAAFLVISALSFDAWLEWWLALGAVAFGVVLMLTKTRRELDFEIPEELPLVL